MIYPTISFNVYLDFTNHFNDENGSYESALNDLNSKLEDLVKNNKLTFLYGNKKVKIVLPIKQCNTGNIFGPEDYDGAHWESIDIPCEIKCSEIKFDPNKLRADLYPDWMDPVRICW